MFFLRVLLGCFFSLLMGKAQCFSDQEKYCLEKNIDEIVVQLMENGYDEQQIFDLINQKSVERADLSEPVVFAFAGVVVICVICATAIGTYLCSCKREGDARRGLVVSRSGLPV